MSKGQRTVAGWLRDALADAWEWIDGVWTMPGRYERICRDYRAQQERIRALTQTEGELRAMIAAADARIAELVGQLSADHCQLSAVEVERLAILAEHAARTAMLAARALRYGWDSAAALNAPTVRVLLGRELGTLIVVAKRAAKGLMD